MQRKETESDEETSEHLAVPAGGHASDGLKKKKKKIRWCGDKRPLALIWRLRRPTRMSMPSGNSGERCMTQETVTDFEKYRKISGELITKISNRAEMNKKKRAIER